MSKRFIDTELFNDPWFMDLSVNSKLLFVYMITNCDHAGIIDMNWKLVEFQTKIKQLTKSYDTLIKELSNRIIRLRNDYYFIPKFISFQYPGFPKSNVRQQDGAIKRLKEFNLWDNENLTLNKELVNSYGNDSVSDTVDVNVFKKEEGTKNCLMRNSGLTIKQVSEDFAKRTDIKDADSAYYYNVVLDWSDSKGKMQIDWMAQIRNFARRDLRESKMKIYKSNISEVNQALNKW